MCSAEVKRIPTLRERALRLLARREHTRAELAAKLRRREASEQELAALLDALEQRGLLSDARYVEARAEALARKFGAARIEQELRSCGVAKELAAKAAAELQRTEIERARTVWRRKFRVAPRSAAERAKQMRFLRSRGFSFEAVRAALGGDCDD